MKQTNRKYYNPFETYNIYIEFIARTDARTMKMKVLHNCTETWEYFKTLSSLSLFVVWNDVYKLVKKYIKSEETGTCKCSRRHILIPRHSIIQRRKALPQW